RPSRYFWIFAVSSGEAPRRFRRARRLTVTSRSIRSRTRTPPRTRASGFGAPSTYFGNFVFALKTAGASANPFSESLTFFAFASVSSSPCWSSSRAFHTELNWAAAWSTSTSHARMIDRTKRGRFSPEPPRESHTPKTRDVGARAQSGPASPRRSDWNADSNIVLSVGHD